MQQREHSRCFREVAQLPNYVKCVPQTITERLWKKCEPPSCSVSVSPSLSLYIYIYISEHIHIQYTCTLGIYMQYVYMQVHIYIYVLTYKYVYIYVYTPINARSIHMQTGTIATWYIMCASYMGGYLDPECRSSALD